MILRWLRKLFPNWLNVACFLIAIGSVVAVVQPLLMVRAQWVATTCPSNLKRIGLAMTQYTQDNDDVLPPRQNNSGRAGALVSWRAILHPYVKSEVAYRCPVNPAGADPEGDLGNDRELDGFSRSYAVNSTAGERDNFGPFADKFSRGLPAGKIQRPELVVAVVESTTAFNDFNILLPEAFAQATHLHRSPGNLFAGHGGRSNYLYADGHVKAQTPRETMDQNARFNPWTIDGAAFAPSDAAKARTTLEFAARYYRKRTP